MDVKIDVGGLQAAIEKSLREYGDAVYVATEEGLDAAADVLIRNLKNGSPEDTGKFKRSWGRKKKYKLQRYVGNTRTVKYGDREVPLSNIIEYGEHSPHRGIIKKIYDSSVDEMADAVVNTIKNKV